MARQNTLITVSKGMKNIFAPGGQSNVARWDRLASSAYGANYGDLGYTLDDYMNSSGNNWFGISKKNNLFSKGNIYDMGLPVIGAGITAADGVLNRGASNAVGNTFNTLGDIGMMLPGPYKAIGLGLKGAGFIANGFTNSVNKEYQNLKNNQILNYANTSSNASDYPQLQMDMDDAMTNTVDLGKIGDWGSKGIFSSGSKRRNAFNNAQAALGTATNMRIADINQRGIGINQRNTLGQLGRLSAFGGYIGGALDIMQDDKHIDAINNRSLALARRVNRFPGGGPKESFFDHFKVDPIKAAVDYINSRKAMTNIFEEAEASGRREKEFQDVQKRLAAAETQNQGLQAMLDSQGLTIQNLMNQQMQNNYADDWRQRVPGVEPDINANGSLREFLKSNEGFKNQAYTLSGEAHPTIGYGFYDIYPGTTRKIKMGDTITRDEADKYLDIAIRQRANELSTKVPNWDKLSSNQRDALIDLAFNAGTNAAHFRKGSKLMSALANENWDAAAQQLDTVSRNSAYNKGLQNRNARRRDVFMNGYKIKAFGGELGTNGTDFTNGLLQVNAGDTHENNPFQGVQLGVDAEGTPNLVEEGETVFNDYVFSNRLTVPYFMKNELGLGGIVKNDITFADASKKIAEESVQRPNDPISMNGLRAGLSKLAQVQEAERMRIQAEEDNAQMEMINQLPLGTYAHGGGIHIDPSKKGTFKAQASKMGMGVQEAASHILANKENYSPAMVKKANFAKNFAHAYGGELGNIFEGKGNKPNNIRRRGISGEYLGNWDDMPVFHTPGLLEAAQMAEEQYYIDNRAKALIKKGMSKGDAYRQAAQERANLATGIAPTAGRGKMTYKYNTPRGVYAKNKAAYSQARQAAKPRQSAGPNMQEQINYRGIRPTNGRGDYNPYAGAIESTGTAPNGVKYTIDRNNVNVLDPYTGSLKFPDPVRAARLQTALGAGALGTAALLTPFALRNNQNTPASYPNDANGILNIRDAVDNVANTQIPTWMPTQPVNPATTVSTPTSTTNAVETPRANTSPKRGARATKPVNTSASAIPSWDKVAQDLDTLIRGQVNDYQLLTKETPIERATPEDFENAGMVTPATTVDTTQVGSDDFKPLSTWMRDVPIWVNGALTLSDALGLTNKADYTYANRIEAAADRLGYAPNIGYNPVDGYVTYNPFDRNYVANRMLDNSAGLRRSILNSNASNGARNAMMLAQNAQDQQGLGQMYRQADESDLSQRLQTGDFNRRTKMVNSQLGLEAAMANARFRQQAQSSRLSGLAQAAAMREAIDQRVGAARSANLTNFLTSLSNLGTENAAINMINSDKAWDYGIGRNGVTGFKNRRRG